MNAHTPSDTQLILQQNEQNAIARAQTKIHWNGIA
jgi:hypothetical protein